ncbi:hypothetical protein [Accumulibacter sp.]|nr:hypothetical protein [Accumulibacter sp.]MBN8498034.1 hypothetical protein [Accumulibacter sp.]MBO3713944.1 hypothetical protein [Accumulibacter sp.]
MWHIVAQGIVFDADQFRLTVTAHAVDEQQLQAVGCWRHLAGQRAT